MKYIIGSQLLATLTGPPVSATVVYHIADHLSPRITTDSSGNSVGQQAHFPFGEDWYASSTTTKFKFTSYERDSESGNDYAMMRTSINRLGRFSSPDPLSGSISNPQSLNRYSYTQAEPIDFVDPSGMDTVLHVDVWAPYLPDPQFDYWSLQSGGLGGPRHAPLQDNGPDMRGGNRSWIGTFVITFFTTVPSTGPGSCIDVALSAVKGPLDTAKKVAENVNKYAAPLANILSSGSAAIAVNLNSMLRSRQLDPFLGPAVAAAATTAAAGLSDLSAGVAATAPYVGAGLAIGAEVIGAIGVGKEAYAAATGKCHP
jgi:RHS repeat-associated protein